MPASARQLIAIKVIGSKRYSESRRSRPRPACRWAPPSTTTTSKKPRAAWATWESSPKSPTASPIPLPEPSSNCTSPTPQKFVPARFEDFVWFSDDELRQRIQQHAPLFDGELPLYGRLADEVSDVLQAMLVERSIPGHVEYQRVGKQDGPVEAIDLPCERCSHSDPQDRIHRSVDPADVARARSCRPQASATANIPALASVCSSQHQLLPVYYARGYLKAEFGPAAD